MGFFTTADFSAYNMGNIFVHYGFEEKWLRIK
jgi:hypothetical protein